MNWIYKHRRVFSMFTLAVFLLGSASQSAQAYYNPKTGKFMQRDPNGTAILVTNALRESARNPTVTVNMAYELQFGDGMNFYEYLKSTPPNQRDPSGLFSLTETAVAAGGFATIGTIAVGAIGAGRSGVGGYVGGMSPKEIAWAMLDGAKMSVAEKLGAVLILSAVAATGPIGLAAVATIGAGFGAIGFANAQENIRSANDFQDLFEASYDGIISVGVTTGSLFVLNGAIKSAFGQSISTPHGLARQGMSRADVAARSSVLQGGRLWRIGTTNISNVQQAQFWALKNPTIRGFNTRYGIPSKNASTPDFVQSGVLKPGTPFVTRVAPGGTEIEVVVPPGGVQLESMSVPTP